MTREEEIMNAIDTIIPISNSQNGRTYEQSLMATGFKFGVNWADSNSKLQWISVEDDLPYKHKELSFPAATEYVLVVLEYIHQGVTYRKVSTSRMILERRNKKGYEKWSWYQTKSYKVTHWMPFPKLPKE